jgi:Flp pilus assembly protein TadD
VYFKLEAYEQAVADYNRALRQDASNPKTYYNRGLALHSLDKKESACHDLNKALELGFKSAEQVIQAYCQ